MVPCISLVSPLYCRGGFLVFSRRLRWSGSASTGPTHPADSIHVAAIQRDAHFPIRTPASLVVLGGVLSDGGAVVRS